MTEQPTMTSSHTHLSKNDIYHQITLLDHEVLVFLDDIYIYITHFSLFAF